VNNRRNAATDWKDFQKSLFEQIPFAGGDWQGKGIEGFVKKTIEQFMPKSLPLQAGLKGFLTKTLDYEVFETHRSIFVRCKLPDDSSPDDVRFYANRRKLRVEYNGHTEEIPLPGDVNSSRTIARYRDGVLEIRMPKLVDAEPFKEIFIRDGGK